MRTSHSKTRTTKRSSAAAAARGPTSAAQACGVVGTGTGAALLLRLPPELAEVLGLRRLSRPSGTHARPVTVRIGDRSAMTECSVGEAGSDVVIGHVALTVLDLVAGNGRLVPRHLDGPVWPLRDIGS